MTNLESLLKPNLDDKMFNHVESNFNLSVPWFLIASYLYYEKEVSIISDGISIWTDPETGCQYIRLYGEKGINPRYFPDENGRGYVKCERTKR